VHDECCGYAIEEEVRRWVAHGIMQSMKVTSVGGETRAMTPVEIEQAVARIIRKHLGPEYRVFLFGSRAGGTARRGSDYDIGIEGPARLDLSTLFVIQNEVEELPTLHKIDIVDFTGTSASFQRVAKMQTKPINV